MILNTSILQEFQASKSKLIAVTKYFDVNITDLYLKELGQYSDIIYGYGENRLELVESKNIEREECHFIGNIQSRKLKGVIDRCSVIHSISTKKYLLLCKKIAEEKQKSLEVFLQLTLDTEKNIGFSLSEITEILRDHDLNSDYFEIIGISGMGSGIFEESEKIAEFQKLIDVRDRYFPGGLISAGTSRDYKIALDMKIDVIRIGTALFQ